MGVSYEDSDITEILLSVAFTINQAKPYEDRNLLWSNVFKSSQVFSIIILKSVYMYKLPRNNYLPKYSYFKLPKPKLLKNC